MSEEQSVPSTGFRWQFKNLRLLQASFYENIEGRNLQELITIYTELKDHLDRVTEVKTTLEKLNDVMRTGKIPEAMDALGISNFKTKTGDRITLYPDMHVSLQSAYAPQFHEWLRERGSGDLVKETVNPQTLKAFIKNLVKDGGESELPTVEIASDEGNAVVPMVSITPFTRAQLTRAKNFDDSPTLPI